MMRTLTADSKVGQDRITHWLLAGGAAGPLLFIVVFLLEEAFRPGYSVWRNYVSQLGTGPGGWVQDLNFVQCGLCCLGCAVALYETDRWPNAPIGLLQRVAIVAGFTWISLLAARLSRNQRAETMGAPVGGRHLARKG